MNVKNLSTKELFEKEQKLKNSGKTKDVKKIQEEIKKRRIFG